MSKTSWYEENVPPYPLGISCGIKAIVGVDPGMCMYKLARSGPRS